LNNSTVQINHLWPYALGFCADHQKNIEDSNAKCRANSELTQFHLVRLFVLAHATHHLHIFLAAMR
jgi:hypothetical protein